MSNVRGLEPERKTALLISECQRGMVDPAVTINPTLSEQAAKRKLADRIAMLAKVCRQWIFRSFASTVTMYCIYQQSRQTIYSPYQHG